MNAGRELDELVAREVFHQTDFEHGEIEETATGHPACVRCGEVGNWGDDIFGDTQCIRRYSTDIAAAWQVVEKMKSDGLDFYLSREMGIWHCGTTAELWRITAFTAPVAICLAALKALGIALDSKE